jgi:hypothetical protein
MHTVGLRCDFVAAVIRPILSSAIVGRYAGNRHVDAAGPSATLNRSPRCDALHER